MSFSESYYNKNKIGEYRTANLINQTNKGIKAVVSADLYDADITVFDAQEQAIGYVEAQTSHYINTNGTYAYDNFLYYKRRSKPYDKPVIFFVISAFSNHYLMSTLSVIENALLGLEPEKHDRYVDGDLMQKDELVYRLPLTLFRNAGVGRVGDYFRQKAVDKRGRLENELVDIVVEAAGRGK